MPTPGLVLVRGGGDVGSAVAHLLFTNGFPVLIHDSPAPTATRRGMAFTDAWFDGTCSLQGVRARHAARREDLETLLAAREVIPVTALPLADVLAWLRPAVLIDARMRKHQQPEPQRHLAGLTIGLGPGFSAGENVHLAVETGRGPDLGRLITQGPARDLQGEPIEIEGHARDRYVYAPQAGLFRTTQRIGDQVTAGQEIARLGDIPLLAPISGTLRGLTRDGVNVAERAKVIEIDPRVAGAQVTGIAERPALIAQGVLAGLRLWGQRGQPPG